MMLKFAAITAQMGRASRTCSSSRIVHLPAATTSGSPAAKWVSLHPGQGARRLCSSSRRSRRRTTRARPSPGRLAMVVPPIEGVPERSLSASVTEAIKKVTEVGAAPPS